MKGVTNGTLMHLNLFIGKAKRLIDAVVMWNNDLSIRVQS
jgi:hypothetical protein